MVISYFSTIMLKLDEQTRGTWITEAGISYIMIAVNVPMGMYFVYDITMDVQEQLELIDYNLLEEEEPGDQAGDMSLPDMLQDVGAALGEVGPRKSMRSKSQDNSSDALQAKKAPCVPRAFFCAYQSACLTPGVCGATRRVKMVNPMLTADD